MEITIIMPALNEEKNILTVVNNTLKAFEVLKIDGELIVVNDGSSDSTPELVNGLAKTDSRIRILNHLSPQGIGACFWDGVDNSRASSVCLVPSDNEIEPYEILRYLKLTTDVDIVIPFVFNKEVRSKTRNFISYLFKSIINTTFGTSLNYTNGTVIYRKSALLELKKRNTGFFYQADILIRLIKNGYLFCEVPYSLRKRGSGRSKAISLRSLRVVIKGYWGLVWDIYIRKVTKQRSLTPDSVSYERYQQSDKG